MGWPMAPKLLLRIMARCSGGEIRNWRRLKSNPSRLRFTPSEGGCIRQISSSVHSLRAGNNTRQAKNDAYHVASRVKEYFPELTVYTSFNPPRWLCRVGDFRSIEEADAMMRRLKATGVFKEVSIVRDQINIPL